MDNNLNEKEIMKLVQDTLVRMHGQMDAGIVAGELKQKIVEKLAEYQKGFEAAKEKDDPDMALQTALAFLNWVAEDEQLNKFFLVKGEELQRRLMEHIDKIRAEKKDISNLVATIVKKMIIIQKEYGEEEDQQKEEDGEG